MILAAGLLAAATPDPRAADAVKLFASLCASGRASPGVAFARLGDGGDMGRRLTDAEVVKLQDGRPGGMAWALDAPSGARLMLDFERGGGGCTVRVAEADAGALRAAFGEAVKLLAAGFGSALSAPVESRSGGIASIGYTYRVNGRTVSVALSSADRVIDGSRHQMNFAFVD